MPVSPHTPRNLKSSHLSKRSVVTAEVKGLSRYRFQEMGDSLPVISLTPPGYALGSFTDNPPQTPPPSFPSEAKHESSPKIESWPPSPLVCSGATVMLVYSSLMTQNESIIWRQYHTKVAGAKERPFAPILN